MTIYLFGHRGALGTALRWAWDRADEEPSELLMADSLLPTGMGPYGADDIVINCIGRLPGAPAAEQIESNAAIPLRLSAEAQRCGAGYVGISTDCVFGVGADAWARAIWPPSGLASAPNDRLGAGPGHRVDSPLAPIDPYGWTKALGEQVPAGLIVRTSFVTTRHGLWRWWRDVGYAGDGWTHAYWSGSTVRAVAVQLLRAIQAEGVPRDSRRIVHLATEFPICKAAALQSLARHDGAVSVIRLLPEPRINRTLLPSGPLWTLPSLEEALRRDGADE